MIEIKNLLFTYENSDFSLRVPELVIAKGERVAFCGPSGCGKTTLVYLIAGIFLPQAGTIRVQGVDVTTRTDAQRRNFRISSIGFIFQEFELLEYLNARDNILLPNFINPEFAATAETARDLKSLAASMGLLDKLARYPAQLSQGEKQRVAICRALINKPNIIIADEPTGNLDPVNGAASMKLIHAQARARGCTLLVVTHDYSLLRDFDRVIDLSNFMQAAAA